MPNGITLRPTYQMDISMEQSSIPLTAQVDVEPQNQSVLCHRLRLVAVGGSLNSLWQPAVGCWWHELLGSVKLVVDGCPHPGL